MDIPNEFVLQMIGTFEAFSKNLMNRYQAEQEKDQSSRITVYFDGYSEETDDLCVRGKQGGETMPPRYADGSFRTRNNKTGLLEYRFRFNNAYIQVYGHSKQECWNKRTDILTGKIKKKEPVLPNVVEAPVKNEHYITYREWSFKWFETFKKPKKYNQKYLNSILVYLDKYINPVIGDIALNKIKSMHLQELLIAIESDNVRTKVAAILSDSFRKACAFEYVNKNVYLGVDFERYENPKLGALSHEQQLILLNSIKENDFFDLTYLLLTTGLRQGEALALTAKDIDFIKLQIIINKTIANDGTITPPKTKASNRIVPFTEQLSKILKSRIKNDTERLFPYRVNYTSHYYSQKFKELNMNFTGHILRHTFITNAYELGFPPYLVQRWVGHSKMQHADVYLALRNAKDYIETDITKYMKDLKSEYVI